MDLSIHAQLYSYEAMNRDVSFLFTSLLMDGCLERGKALLDGGVRYLGAPMRFTAFSTLPTACGR